MEREDKTDLEKQKQSAEPAGGEQIQKLTDFEHLAFELAKDLDDYSFIEKGMQLTNERDELLSRLDDFNEFNDVARFKELEATFFEKEAEFSGDIKILRAIAEKGSWLITAKRVTDREKHFAELVSLSLSLRARMRMFSDFASKVSDEPEPPHDRTVFDRTVVDLLVSLRDKKHEKMVANLRDSIDLYTNVLHRYKWTKRHQRLRQHGFKVFWGLFVGTILVGMLFNKIPYWSLSALLLPALSYLFLEKARDRWIEKRIQEMRRASLQRKIIDLYGARIKADIYRALDAHIFKSFTHGGQRQKGGDQENFAPEPTSTAKL